MAITHIVMFEFNPALEKAKVDEICGRVLSLKNQCVHPATKDRYIKSASGGKNDNPGPSAVYQYGFVMEFESEEDRKYYLDEDPAHIELKNSLKGSVERFGCLDYKPGVF